MAGKTWSAEDIERWKKSQVNNAQSFVSENKYEEIPAIKPANDNKQSTNSRWTAEDVAKRALNNSISTSISPNTGTQIDVDRLIATDYKMSKDERKEARKYAKDELNDYGKKFRSGEISKEEYSKMIMDPNSELNKMHTLYNKTNPLTSFSLGFISGVPGMDALTNLASEKGDLSSQLLLQNQENAQTQNKGANIAGNLAGSAATYSALSPVLQSIPALNNVTGKAAGTLAKLPGLSKVGAEPIKNILSDMAVDVGLDTIPMIAKDVQEEKSAGEIAKDTALNIGGNLAGNIIGESAPAILKTIIDKRVNGAEKVAENSLEQAAESLKSSESKLENIVSDVEGNGKKLKREAAQSVPGNVSKSAQGNGRTSEDSLNDHIKIEVKKAINRTPLTNNPAEIVTLFEERAKIVKKYGDDKSKKALRQFKSAIKEFSADGKVTTYQKVLDAAKNLDSSLLNMSPVKSKLNKLKTDMKSLVDLYGDKDTEELFDKFKTEVDAFEIDGNPESINNIMELAYELDKSMKGKAYTSPDILGKRGGVKQKGFSHRYGQGVSVKTVLNESLDSINEILPTKNPLSLEKFLINSVESADVEDDIIKNVPTQGQAAVPELKNILKNYERAVLANGDDDAWEELDVFRTALNNFETTGSIDAFRRVLNSSNRLDANLNGLSAGNSIPVLEKPITEKAITEKTIIDKPQKEQIPFLKFERKWRQGATGDINPPKMQPIKEPNLKIPELNNGEYIRRTATNTLAKSEAFRDNPEMMAVLQDEINSGNMTFKTVTEDESLSKAREALKKDPDGEFKRLLNSDGWTESKDVDEAMMFIKASGDDNDFDNVRRMARKFGAQGHEAATVLQALAKYSRTSEGSIAKAQVILDNQIKKWAKNNPKEAQTSKQIVDEFLQARKGIEMNLQMFGKKITDATDDQIKNAILDIVKRYNLESKFDESNINSIIRLIRGGDANDIKSSVESIMATKKYGISDETIAQVRAFFDEADQYGADSKKRVELENKAFALLANDVVTPSWSDKWDAWRYFAMLHKLTTHERNFIGNAVMYGISEIKDELSALMEATVDAVSKNGIERTKTTSFGFTSDKHKALIKAANKYADDVAYRQLVGSKYNAKAGIQSQSKAFRKGPGKFIQKVVDFNSDLLEKEDMLFLRTKYGRALAGYLKANGADASIFTKKDDASKKLLEKASEYAIKEAKRVTFHEDSLFADLLTDASRKLKEKGDMPHFMLHATLEGLDPFKKTPINIMKTGARYSPIGVLNAIRKGLSAVRSGKYTASEVIDSLSAGLTGTAIMGLGVWFGAKGLVRGNGTGDKNQDAFDKLHGEQNYALQIGDHNYTIDWLAPSVLPFLVGVELQKALENDGNYDSSELLNALMGIAEPVIETSMLQGVSDMLNSIRYAEDNASMIAGVATDLATGYISQGLPISLSGLARSFDNTRRNPSSDKRGVVGQLDYFKNSTMNKIPFLSENNPEYRDEWGRTQQNFSGANGNVLGNMAYQFLSPGYYSKDNVTPVDSYLQKLYNSPNIEENVLPSKIDRSVKIDKKTVRMDGEQYSKAQKIAGETSYELIDSLRLNSDSASKVAQSEAIPVLYGVSKAIAYNELMGKPIAQTYEKSVGIYKELGADGLVRYILAKSEADTDGSGALKKEELEYALEKKGFTNSVVDYLLNVYNKKW